jgi:drug/metabolite transporter (DMT)-like permease
LINKRPKIKAEFILIGVVVIWGYTFPVIKNVLESIPPFTFLSYRFFLALSIIYLIFSNRLKTIDLLTIKKGFLSDYFCFWDILDKQ